MAIVERSVRVRAGFRRFAILAFVILLPFALHALWDYVEARRLARLVAEIRAKHEPVAVIPTASVEMGNARNAARFYDAAAALLIDTRALYGPTGMIRELQAGTGDGRARALARVRSWLEENAEAEAMLDRATAHEFLGYPPGTDYNYRWDRLGMLANLADLRSLERVAAGDGDGALTGAIQQVRLARAVESSEATTVLIGDWSYPLISRCAASVQQALPLHPSDKVLADAQRAFRAYDVDSALEQTVLIARAKTLGTFWDAADGWYSRAPGRALSPAVWFVARPLIAHRIVQDAREMNTWLEIARRPWPDRLHTPASPSPGRPPAPSSYRMLEFMARVNLAAMGERFKGVGIGLASIRTLDAALAVERYRLAHDGRVPAALSEMAPSLLPAVPVDPYSGEPIKYRLTPERYVVYSVGPDGKDDGGADVEWPRRPGSLYLTATPPRDIGVEGNRK